MSPRVSFRELLVKRCPRDEKMFRWYILDLGRRVIAESDQSYATSAAARAAGLKVVQDLGGAPDTASNEDDQP